MSAAEPSKSPRTSAPFLYNGFCWPLNNGGRRGAGEERRRSLRGEEGVLPVAVWLQKSDVWLILPASKVVLEASLAALTRGTLFEVNSWIVMTLNGDIFEPFVTQSSCFSERRMCLPSPPGEQRSAPSTESVMKVFHVCWDSQWVWWKCMEETWSPESLCGPDPSRPYISVIKGRLNDAGPWQHDFCLIATLLH